MSLFCIDIICLYLCPPQKTYSFSNISIVKYPILKGIGIGVGLSFWQPEDPTSKATAILWVGLVGDLFIRALKCIVLPLVFVSIAISVMDMLSLGKAGKLVGSTIGLYVLTTLCAALIGKYSRVYI